MFILDLLWNITPLFVCFQGGMFTKEDPSQLLIVLEPEAASIYCRRLRMHQLMPEVGTARPLQSPRRSMELMTNMPAVSNLTVGMSTITLLLAGNSYTPLQEDFLVSMCVIVVTVVIVVLMVELH